jgi:hypothetical protein
VVFELYGCYGLWEIDYSFKLNRQLCARQAK